MLPLGTLNQFVVFERTHLHIFISPGSLRRKGGSYWSRILYCWWKCSHQLRGSLLPFILSHGHWTALIFLFCLLCSIATYLWFLWASVKPFSDSAFGCLCLVSVLAIYLDSCAAKIPSSSVNPSSDASTMPDASLVLSLVDRSTRAVSHHVYTSVFPHIN